MIHIELENGQSGYNAVGNCIKRYWEHNIADTVIVSMSISYDDKKYEKHNELAYPIGMDDIEFLYDWWEGEKYINIFGIQSINEIKISGGLYE